MALTFNIGANERAAVQSVKNLGKALDDTSDKLDDLAKDTGIERLERGFSDLAREAKQAERAVERVGDGSKTSFKRAGDATSDLKDEARQNFSEITSSFDGSMESIGDLAQGTLGGIASSGLPGIGLAAGVAAAAVGGITTYFTELADKAKEVKEGIIGDFVEIGDALDQEAVDARVRDLLGNENTRKQALLLKDILGVDLAQALLILAGDFEAAGTTAEDALRGVQNAGSDVDLQVWAELKNTMEATNEALAVGPALAKAREDASARAGEAERAQIKRTQDADQARFELYAAAVQNARNNASSGIKIPVTLEDRTDVSALRSSILRRVGRISVPIGVDLWQ